MEFINQNTELVITLLTMTLIWILGFISKRCPYVNNNLIIIQNIVIGLSVSIFYFIIIPHITFFITKSYFYRYFLYPVMFLSPIILILTANN